MGRGVRRAGTRSIGRGGRGRLLGGLCGGGGVCLEKSLELAWDSS